MLLHIHVSSKVDSVHSKQRYFYRHVVTYLGYTCRKIGRAVEENYMDTVVLESQY